MYSLYRCVNRSDRPECARISWHSLPINYRKRLRTLLVNVKRTKAPGLKHSYLCSELFAKESFKKVKVEECSLKWDLYLRDLFLPPGKQPSKRKAPVDRRALPRDEMNVNIPPQEPVLPVNDPLVEA